MICLSALAMGAFGVGALAAPGDLVSTLNNPAPEAFDEFGNHVATDSERVVVGAWRDNPGSVAEAGTAYVFNATTGALLLTLDNPAPEPGDRFGVAVAISNNLAVVGAYLDDPNSVVDAGTAYVFDVTDGTLLLTLDNPNPEAGDRFGVAVAIFDNKVLVGADFADPNNVVDAGTAYIFDATTGALLVTLDNPNPTTEDIFGAGVALVDNLAFVGAVLDDPNSVTDAGTAYVFDATTGALLVTLDNPNPTTRNDFGVSLASDGELVVVGARLDDPGSIFRAGTAYVFDVATGQLVATLNNPDPTINDFFGVRVAICGDLALTGAQSNDLGGSNVGRAYVFNATTGALVLTLDNPAPAPGDIFGVAIAFADNRAVVGARFDSPGVTRAGSAYVFDVSCTGTTPVGTDVVVTPDPVDKNGDPIAGAPEVTITFDEVTVDGETTVTITGAGPQPPTGFRLIPFKDGPMYIVIETTATFVGFVEICIDYSGLSVAGMDENLKFAHKDGSVWVDLMAVNDTTNKIICATVSSFSFFAILEVADPVVLLDDLANSVAALNIKKGINNAFDAKLDAVERAITDAIEQNDLVAINVLLEAFVNAVEAQRGKELSDDEANDLISRAEEIALVLEDGAVFP